MTPVKRTVPIHIKKLPTYKGFRVREYRPLVFSSSAICPSLVFLPEVFLGVNPIVYTRIKNQIAQHKLLWIA